MTHELLHHLYMPIRTTTKLMNVLKNQKSCIFHLKAKSSIQTKVNKNENNKGHVVQQPYCITPYNTKTKNAFNSSN